MDFTNKNVVITGGSSGIGLATAKVLIKAGANVLITGRNAEKLKKASSEINSSKLKTLVSDIANLKDIAELEATVSQIGKINALFLNAAIATSATAIEETTEKEFDNMFNVNVKGLYFTLQKLIPHLTDGSSVIVASSGMSVGAYHQTSVYSASKAAVDAIARVAANELADRNIRVNILAPGVTDTPMNFGGKTTEEIKAAKDFFEDRIPLKRIANAEEIANTVAFLASDESSYVTGAYLSADGGAILRKW